LTISSQLLVAGDVDHLIGRRQPAKGFEVQFDRCRAVYGGICHFYFETKIFNFIFNFLVQRLAYFPAVDTDLS